MKVGKVEEKVYKRSIGIYLPASEKQVVVGAGTGVDAAVLGKEFFENEMPMVASATFIGKPDIVAKWAIADAVNNIAASHGRAKAVSIMLTLPEKLREINLKKIMSHAGEECEKKHIAIIGGHTEISDKIESPIFSVTAFGNGVLGDAKVKAGQDIVMTGYAGAAGSAIIAHDHTEKLQERFPKRFIESAVSLDEYRYVDAAVAVAEKSDAYPMHDAGEGGIFGALWEFAQRYGIGLEIETR
ncbi:MAG: hypothetical protein K6F37_03640, partial [Lachnospiraceae bacterium]|nr:hypothetical protein [Lachnospiraceae bacterium]